METDADAQADFRSFRYRSEVGLHSVPEVLHRWASAQISSDAEIAHPLPSLPVPVPIGAGESQLMPSGTTPLQSDAHSNIPSNFAVVQNVVQPAAQQAAQSLSRNSL